MNQDNKPNSQPGSSQSQAQGQGPSQQTAALRAATATATATGASTGTTEGNGGDVCNSMQFEVKKDKDGWYAETSINLGDQRVFRLRTCKHRQGGLVSRGSVANIERDMLVTALGQDYSRVYKHDPLARCSEKAVKEFHGYFLSRLAEIRREISLHYNPTPWVIVINPGQSDESIHGEYRYQKDARDCLRKLSGADLMKRTDSGLLTTEF